MTEALTENVVAKTFGHSIYVALGLLIAWLAGGSTGVQSALLSLLLILGGIIGLAFSLIRHRYMGVLGAGAEPQGSLERRAYDALRESLRDGGSVGRLYAQWLTGFLDAVDRFFGDAGMANRSVFAHALGLRTPAPLWTGPAFDRCLFVSWIYPILAIFLIWAIPGRVGPAEAALQLKPDLAAWQRGSAVALVGFGIAALLKARRKRDWKHASLAGVGVAALLYGVTSVSGLLAAAISIVVMYFAVALRVSGLNIGSGFVYVGGSLMCIILGCIIEGFICLIYILIFIVLFVIVSYLVDKAIERQYIGIFYCIFIPSGIIISLSAAYMLASKEKWGNFSPLMLFLVLLVLFNAPFDWASLGLTRGLLRRGLELAGWWPFVLALVDAALAAVIVVLLAIAMVFAVQTFNEVAVHGGGVAILPLEAVFEGIAAKPTASEYWWVYALLLTTMIPSLINLGIGGASLMRGMPGVPSLLLRYMPAERAVPTFDRPWIALVLALQLVIGTLLGIAAQAFILVAMIVYALPWLGPGLLDMARDVVAFDLPSHLWQLFAGKP